MKLRVIDRLIAGVIGVLLLVMSVILLTEAVFSDRLLNTMGSWAAGKSGSVYAVLIGAVVILALAGVLSFQLAVRRTKSKGFVVQSTDVGELSISIRAIDNLVQRCVEKHEELHVTSTTLDNTRDGLVISMRINLAGGVNIPLAVTALQKQIKQYVTACSGVDVHEVKVQVDTTAAKAKPSIYAVPDMMENPAPLPREEEVVPEIEEAPAAEEPVAEKEEKCLHQRLFGAEEQPAIVPTPPEMTVEQPDEEAETPAPAEEEAEVEAFAEEPAAEEEAAEPEQKEELNEEAAVEPEADLDELVTLAGLSDEADGYDEDVLNEMDALDGEPDEDILEEKTEPVQEEQPAAEDAEAEEMTIAEEAEEPETAE